MVTGSSDEDMLDWRDLRECQESEIALGHSLTAAEHALARDAMAAALRRQDRLAERSSSHRQT